MIGLGKLLLYLNSGAALIGRLYQIGCKQGCNTVFAVLISKKSNVWSRWILCGPMCAESHCGSSSWWTLRLIFTLFHNTWFLVHCKTNKQTKETKCQTPDPGYKRGTTDSHTEYMEHLHYATFFIKPFCTDIDAPSDFALTFAEPWREEVQKALIRACQWFSVLAWNCLISFLQFCPQDLRSQQSQNGIQVVFMLTKVELTDSIQCLVAVTRAPATLDCVHGQTTTRGPHVAH